MTRLAFLAIGLTIGLAAGYWLARKRREPVRPCPEYKVYDDKVVSELETIAKTRRLSK